MHGALYGTAVCLARILVERWGEIRLAVVYFIRGIFNFDFEGVELAVGGRWGECEAVFMTD